MKKLERQIDFLVALTDLKPSKNETQAEEVKNPENIYEEKADWRDKLKALFRAE
jgi:hypothetical protein